MHQKIEKVRDETLDKNGWKEIIDFFNQIHC